VGRSASDDDARRTNIANKPPAGSWLLGGGEMGKVIRAMDWSGTPLGHIDSWPQSLRTTVSLCLASNFPISIAWGPQHIQIYNDGYWPICGAKHPQAMGQDFSECWASAWPAIGVAFDGALRGQTSYLEDQRMFLDRNGYLEETFFTFSFSPILDESGVGGLFHPVSESTGRMLGERRTRALRDVSARTGKAKTSLEAQALLGQVLHEFGLDLPFTLLYSLDEDGKTARLVSSSGLPKGTALSAQLESLNSLLQPAVWPIAEVVESKRALHITGLRTRFETIDWHGPYEEAPDAALALPLTLAGFDRPGAVMIAGVSSRLALNESYRTFYDLLGAAVSTALGNARAYEQERERAEALAEIDRTKTAFFSNVSHEFRTPLTLILAPLEDELNEQLNALPPDRRERLETAHRNALRLLKLVNTLLDFSRIEAGRIDGQYEEIDLGAYTAELVSVFRSAADKAQLTLTVECQPLSDPYYVDRDMWEKVVLNLVSNAFKHTFEGGIRVSLIPCEGGAELSVEDTGVGIPATELPKLFDRFHRVRGTRSRTHEGTGIGLALVQELVGLHQGTVSVDSREGEGTRFKIRLKAGFAHLPSDRVTAGRVEKYSGARAAAYVQEAMHWLPNALPAKETCTDDIAPTSAAGARARLLWADDNADMRDYVTRLLRDEYDVVAVPEGAAALAEALERVPDLVLSDVMMPRLDGFGLLHALRTDIRTRNVPVILLSARAGEESAVEGLDAGADDYLAKPFSARELRARVRTHLELARTRRQWADELERANHELEAFSYSVSHDLRAPLRAIDGFSKALLSRQADKLDAQGKEHLKRVRAATAHMSSLIDDLLQLARISRTDLRRDSIAISELVTTLFDELQQQNPHRNAKLEVEPGLIAQADRRLVRVVLENLLSNAWKFSSKRPETRIFVNRVMRDGQGVFCVRDNGAGFDPAYAGNLFKPFQRLHTQADFEGTGVGLATVQRIVSRHGGRVWAEGSVDHGASFFFSLGDTR
jgi:signal transduction histidine kinase